MSKKIKTAAVETITADDVLIASAAALETIEAEEAAELEALSQLESEGGPATVDPEVIGEPTAEIVTDPVIAQADDAAGDEQAEVPSLADLIEAVDEERATMVLDDIGAAFDDRIAFEKTKNGLNETIQSSLKKSRKSLERMNVATLFAATDVDPYFVNGSRSAGSGYNVYAIDKVADLVGALTTGIMRNAINVAVTRSLFRFRAAGEVFTGELARAAASDKIRIQGRVKDLLVRHTVSAGTAPTQASSTMSALQTLGIVVNKGSMKSPIYELVDNAQTRALAEALEEPYAIAA